MDQAAGTRARGLATGEGQLTSPSLGYFCPTVQGKIELRNGDYLPTSRAEVEPLLLDQTGQHSGGVTGDNLEGLWKSAFGVSRGIVVLNAFRERQPTSSRET